MSTEEKQLDLVSDQEIKGAQDPEVSDGLTWSQEEEKALVKKFVTL